MPFHHSRLRCLLGLGCILMSSEGGACDLTSRLVHCCGQARDESTDPSLHLVVCKSTNDVPDVVLDPRATDIRIHPAGKHLLQRSIAVELFPHSTPATRHFNIAHSVSVSRAHNSGYDIPAKGYVNIS